MFRYINALSLAIILFVCTDMQSKPESEVKNAISSPEKPVQKIAPYVLIIQDANIFLKPTTNSTIIAKARKGDVFKLSNVTSGWYKIYMFSGEPRYIQQSYARDTTATPPLPTTAIKACREIISAQDRAMNESMQKYPNDFSQQIDYERILMDKYELQIFQKYNIPPAHKTKLNIQCAKNF